MAWFIGPEFEMVYVIGHPHTIQFNSMFYRTRDGVAPPLSKEEDLRFLTEGMWLEDSVTRNCFLILEMTNHIPLFTDPWAELEVNADHYNYPVGFFRLDQRQPTKFSTYATLVYLGNAPIFESELRGMLFTARLDLMCNANMGSTEDNRISIERSYEIGVSYLYRSVRKPNAGFVWGLLPATARSSPASILNWQPRYDEMANFGAMCTLHEDCIASWEDMSGSMSGSSKSISFSYNIAFDGVQLSKTLASTCLRDRYPIHHTVTPSDAAASFAVR